MADTLAIMPTFLRSKEDLILTENAIRSLRDTCDADLLVVDDYSPDLQLAVRVEEICEEVGAEFDRRPQNDGFSRTVNVGLRRARKTDRHALLVNADIEFIGNGWFDHMRQNPAAVVGALLLYPNLLIQHAGVYFSVIVREFDHIYRGAPMTLAQAHEPRICPVTGALQLIKHETLKKIGIYDENFRMGYEDVDYCHQVFKSGMQCAYEPQAQAIHHESMFRKRDPSKQLVEWQQQSWEYLHQKHAGHNFADYVPTLMEWPR